MKNDSSSAAYCKVCLLAHDEEIHEATLAVRDWHRKQVVKGFEVRDEDSREEQIQSPRVA